MGKLSIKIKIAEREYPIKAPAHEEGLLRTAGKFINDRLRQYKEQFGIQDKQDLLAMIALDCVVEKLRSEADQAGIQSAIAGKIEDLDKLVSAAL